MLRCPAGHNKLNVTDKEFEEHQFHTIEAPQTNCSLCSSVMALVEYTVYIYGLYVLYIIPENIYQNLLL